MRAAGNRTRLSDLLLDVARIVLLLRVASRHTVEWMLLRAFRSTRNDTPAVRLRRALEELGLTYLKLGQYLSTRFDILPHDICQELDRLLENVRPVGFDDIRGVVERELGGSVDTLFSRFEREPIASASVAQVHEAYTQGGERVAVKVQRPGIGPIFAADMRNLRRLARLLDAFDVAGGISVGDVVNVFENWTRRELDFRIEAATADRLRRTAVPGEVIPRIHDDLTSSRVLTLEYMDGVSLAVVTGLLQEGRTLELADLLPALDVEEVGHLLATACLHQMFGVGLFHGDPHPGNILVLRDNRIAFVDFGIFGELSAFQRHVLSSHMESIAAGNIELSFYYYAKQAIPSRDTDQRRFAKESKELFRQWYAASQDPFASPEERHLGRFSAMMFEIVRRNHVRLTVDTLLFWRAMNALASTAVRLPDYFDLLGEMRGYFEATRPGPIARIAELFALPAVVERSAQLRGILETLPTASGELRDGTLDINVEVEESRDESLRDTWLAKTVAGAIVGASLLLVASTCSNATMRVALDGIAAACLLRPVTAFAWR